MSLNDINKEIDRLNAIITDLLSLVKMDDQSDLDQTEPVDLSMLVDKTVNGLKVLAKRKDITLETMIEPEVITRGDAAKLQQAISNLVDNAIKYTPKGGRVMVDVYKGDDEAVVKVSDTGIGIPVEDIPHIFDRF